MTLAPTFQISRGGRQITKKSEVRKEQQEEYKDIGGYLSYLTLDHTGKTCFINGESRWAIPLPTHIDQETLERLVYKYCHKFDVDYVSPDNVSLLVNEKLWQFNTGYITKSRNKKDSKKKQRKQKKKKKENNTIATVIIEKCKMRVHTLTLTTDKFYLQEELKRPYKKNNSKVTGNFININTTRETNKTTIITMRPPILSKVLKVDSSSQERELLVVQYGSDEILGDVKDVCDKIAKIGGVASQHFKTYVSAILEAQRDKTAREITYPAIGIFENPENKKLVIAMPQSNNVYAIGQAKENGEVNERICEVANKTLPGTEEEIRSALIGYIRLPSFFKYATDTIPVLGYSIATAFAYELKSI